EVALDGDELGEEDAVHAVGRLGAQAEGELAAALDRDQVEEVVRQLVDLGLVEARAAQAHTEDVPLALDLDVPMAFHVGPSLAVPASVRASWWLACCDFPLAPTGGPVKTPLDPRLSPAARAAAPRPPGIPAPARRGSPRPRPRRPAPGRAGGSAPAR